MDYKVKLPDNSEIVLLYTNKFEWKDKEQQKLLENTPLTGRVYRALKTNDSAYYIHLNLPKKGQKKRIDGIRITNLTSTAPEWDCIFTEVDEDNIVDFDMVPEDYQSIGQWLETKQQDFIDKLFKNEGLDVVASNEDDVQSGREGDLSIKETNSVKGLMDLYQKSIAPYDQKAIESIQWISMRDPFALQAFAKILGKYTEFMDEEDETPIHPIKRDICTSSDLGKIANITLIADAFEKYTRTKDQDNEILLFEMLLPILFEYMRAEINKPFENE